MTGTIWWICFSDTVGTRSCILTKCNVCIYSLHAWCGRIKGHFKKCLQGFCRKLFLCLPIGYAKEDCIAFFLTQLDKDITCWLSTCVVLLFDDFFSVPARKLIFILIKTVLDWVTYLSLGIGIMHSNSWAIDSVTINGALKQNVIITGAMNKHSAYTVTENDLASPVLVLLFFFCCFFSSLLVCCFLMFCDTCIHR